MSPSQVAQAVNWKAGIGTQTRVTPRSSDHRPARGVLPLPGLRHSCLQSTPGSGDCLPATEQDRASAGPGWGRGPGRPSVTLGLDLWATAEYPEVS